jgi:signal transduction histidine kinase
VDRDRVLQILSNYLSNAVKFTPAGGSIALHVTRLEGGGVRFAVSDTGPGIAPEDLPHVFSRFWQAERTKHLGSGLGLTIAKGIAEVHRGRVWAESTPGSGSTFFFAVSQSDACS